MANTTVDQHYFEVDTTGQHSSVADTIWLVNIIWWLTLFSSQHCYGVCMPVEVEEGGGEGGWQLGTAPSRRWTRKRAAGGGYRTSGITVKNFLAGVNCFPLSICSQKVYLLNLPCTKGLHSSEGTRKAC